MSSREFYLLLLRWIYEKQSHYVLNHVNRLVKYM